MANVLMSLSESNREALAAMFLDDTQWVFITQSGPGAADCLAIQDAVIDPSANTTTCFGSNGVTMLFVKKAILPIDQLQLVLARRGHRAFTRESLAKRNIFMLDQVAWWSSQQKRQIRLQDILGDSDVDE